MSTGNRSPVRSTVIRPLTHAERQKPAQLAFMGGFRNVCFQIGQLILPVSTEQNTNNVTPIYSQGFIQKSPTLKFPVMVPNSISVLKGMSNTVTAIIGQSNIYGGFDAVMVARGIERLSSLNSKLRTVESLIQSAANEDKPTEDARLGKSSGARVHNQVMLTGVVVGANFEDGENPKFHILIRQTADPKNVIPLTYEARNASAMVSRVKFGSLIYVDGEYAFRNLPVYELDEDGKVKHDENKKPIPVLDGEGKQAKRTHTYIRITSPKDPAEYDTDFGGGIPGWVVAIAQEITASRTRATTHRTEQAAANQAAITKEADEITAAIPAVAVVVPALTVDQL